MSSPPSAAGREATGCDKGTPRCSASSSRDETGDHAVGGAAHRDADRECDSAVCDARRLLSVLDLPLGRGGAFGIPIFVAAPSPLG